MKSRINIPVGMGVGSEVMVTKIRKYIFKSHVCFWILNSRKNIPVGFGVGSEVTVTKTRR